MQNLCKVYENKILDKLFVLKNIINYHQTTFLRLFKIDKLHLLISKVDYLYLQNQS